MYVNIPFASKSTFAVLVRRSSMNEVTQIRVGKHLTGIIGLKSALAEAADRCKGMDDDQIGEMLLEILGKRNYIETSFRDVYARAFVGEYKKFIGEPVTEARGQGLTIKVLGPGCAQCDRLEHEVMTVMSENGITAALEHVRDVAEIARLGVMGVPALLINGEVKAVGSVPPRERIKLWLTQAEQQT
jgi:small redox-active disulfide protein 2